MDISKNSLFAQMQSMSLEAGGSKVSSLPTESISSVNPSGNNFGNLLKDAINNVSELQLDAGSQRTAFELGDRSVSLAQTMVAAQKAGVAFDATVQVRNKFVEAYKEIMSMPV